MVDMQNRNEEVRVAKFTGAEVSEGDLYVLCELFTDIGEFADRDYQERVWVRGEGDEVTSYSDAMVAVLEDRRIFDFAADLGRFYGLDDRARDALRTFADALEDFNASGKGDTYDDAEIINSSEWPRISALAQLALQRCETWCRENCTRQVK